MRICSLLPSATEMVAALGFADSLVAVSAECDWPPEVRGRPVVSASRVELDRLSSLQIDAAVREAASDGRPLYTVDRDVLEQLEPDVILTQKLCDVCAVSADAVDELHLTGAQVVPLDAYTVDEIKQRVLDLAELLGVPERGRAIVERMEATIGAAQAAVAEAPVRPVFLAEWVDPPFVAGHWIPDMVALAGGRDVLAKVGGPSYPTTWDAVREQWPELVIVAACGFDAQRGALEAAQLRLGCRTVAVDSNAFYARPGPRVADGIAQLAHLIHPELAADPGLPFVELTPA